LRTAFGWGHVIGFGIGFATLGTIGFEGCFDYAAIGTVSTSPLAFAMGQARTNPH
jgi:hypothetical protein